MRRAEKQAALDNRMTKTELVHTVSEKTGVEVSIVRTVYAAIVDEIVSIVRKGGAVMLTGFGRFYRLHKAGHAVQFTKPGQGRVKGYDVLKFSASSTLNKSLTEHGEDTQ